MTYCAMKIKIHVRVYLVMFFFCSIKKGPLSCSGFLKEEYLIVVNCESYGHLSPLALKKARKGKGELVHSCI